MIIDENITDDLQFTPQGVFVTGHDLKEFKTQKSLDKAVAREFENNALISFLYNEYISKRNSDLTEREIVGFDIDDKRYNENCENFVKERKRLQERKDQLTRFILEKKYDDGEYHERRIDQSPILALVSKFSSDYFRTFKNSNKMYREAVANESYKKITDVYSKLYTCAHYSNKERRTINKKLNILKECSVVLNSLIPGLYIAVKEKLISPGHHKVLMEELECTTYAVGSWIKIIDNKLKMISK